MGDVPALLKLAPMGSSPGTDLISATTTKAGLTVRCELDPAFYPKGIVVSDDEMAAINIARDSFH